MDSRTIAQTIDHAVLHPRAGKHELSEAIRMVTTNEVYSICVKPCHVEEAVAMVDGHSTVVSTVIDFPHGNMYTNVKVEEARKMLQLGARELDVVLNQAWISDKEWGKITDELSAINSIARANGAIVKAIFENHYIKTPRTIVTLCDVCKDAEVAYIKTSTGFAFSKDAEDDWYTSGATDEDVQLMLSCVGPSLKVKASGGIRDYRTAKHFLDMGVARLGTSSTVAILAEARKKENQKA